MASSEVTLYKKQIARLFDECAFGLIMKYGIEDIASMLAEPRSEGTRQIQYALTGAANRIARNVRWDGEIGHTDFPVTAFDQGAARWFIDQTDAVQYTFSRKAIQKLAKSIGVEADMSRAIK